MDDGRKWRHPIGLRTSKTSGIADSSDFVTHHRSKPRHVNPHGKTYELSGFEFWLGYMDSCVFIARKSPSRLGAAKGARLRSLHGHSRNREGSQGIDCDRIADDQPCTDG